MGRAGAARRCYVTPPPLVKRLTTDDLVSQSRVYAAARRGHTPAANVLAELAGGRGQASGGADGTTSSDDHSFIGNDRGHWSPSALRMSGTISGSLLVSTMTTASPCSSLTFCL